MRNMTVEFRVGDIREVADNYVRVRDGRFYIDFPVVARYRMNRGGGWELVGFHFGLFGELRVRWSTRLRDYRR